MNSFNWHSVKHKIANLKRKTMLTRTRLAILLLGLVALWGLMWLGITTQTVIMGQQVRELDAQLDRTLRENAQLEYDIAVLTQPDRIAKRAAALGLRPASPSQTVYLDIKYGPRAAYGAEKKLVGSPPAFDWAAWFNDALAAIGLSVSSRSAEASQ